MEALVRELSEIDSVPGVLDAMQMLTKTSCHNAMFSRNFLHTDPENNLRGQESQANTNASRCVYDHGNEPVNDCSSSRGTALPITDEDNESTQIPNDIQTQKTDHFQTSTRRSKLNLFNDDTNPLSSKLTGKRHLFCRCIHVTSTKTRNAMTYLNLCDKDNIRLSTPYDKCLFCQRDSRTELRSLRRSFELETQTAKPTSNVASNPSIISCSALTIDRKGQRGIGPPITSSKYAQHSIRSETEPPFKAANQNDRKLFEKEPVNLNCVLSSNEEKGMFRNRFTNLLSSLRWIVSSAVKLLLYSRLLTWICKYENRRASQTLHGDKTFLTKTSVRNPAYMTAEGGSKVRTLQCKPEEAIQFLQGKQAFDYYKLLSTTETAMNLKQIKRDRIYLIGVYTMKKKLLSEFVEMAKGVNVNIIVSCVIMVIALIVICATFGLDRPGVHTFKKSQGNIPTLLGSETFTVLEESNPWIGPPERCFWVAAAAVTPCMGGNFNSIIVAARDNGPHRKTTIGQRHNQTQPPEMGCCEMGSHINRAGTTTYADCHKLTFGLGNWRSGVICSKRTTPNNHVAHVIKPCCERRTGACQMLSHEHCVFIDGVFHIALDHCGQTVCIESLCRLKYNNVNAVLPGDSDSWRLTWPYWLAWLAGGGTEPGPKSFASGFSRDTTDVTVQKKAPNQWWRLVTALPLTFGVIHLLLVLVVEAAIMLPVEIYTGWHRVLLIYVCSALAGEMMACSVEPSRPHVGSTAGAAGFLGVAYLELLQAWTFLPCPSQEAAGLVGVTLVFLALGTLHLVSLVSVLTGLVVGSALCLMIVPYITLGQRSRSGRLRVVLVGFVLFMLVALVTHFCYATTLSPASRTSSALLMKLRRFLRNWECVPYSERMCITYRHA
ncbi:inactive rhomboid protein [Elysia marginata]|uniref:Inactive rhomboid protein n=1 Tax=Elysia marginata TaxID=1093978 RepID=A0AAV4JGL3_9GAST|nr:inactive rhomboid protein [Elysia marginata]